MKGSLTPNFIKIVAIFTAENRQDLQGKEAAVGRTVYQYTNLFPHRFFNHNFS